MQVILDYAWSGTGHVCGTVESRRGVAVRPFDGWLDLMRLLEDLERESSDVSTGPSSALSRETRPAVRPRREGPIDHEREAPAGEGTGHDAADPMG